MTRVPSSSGLTLALAALAVASVLLVAWWLGRRETTANLVEVGANAAASVDASAAPPAPTFVGDRTPLAPDEAAAIAAGASLDTIDDLPPGSAVARWTGAKSTFTGRVVDHEGRPLAGATVTCWPSQPTREALGFQAGVLAADVQGALSATTDDTGHFELRVPHVPFAPDQPWVDERDPGLLVEAAGFAARSVPCTGLLAGDYDAGTIALEPGGDLIGRMIDEEGRPIVGARLLAQQQRCDPRFVAKQDDWWVYSGIDPVVSDVSRDDGRFELGGFWPGTASFWVEADGYLAIDRERETVVIGERHDLGDLVLSSGRSLVGVIVDDAGAPVSGAAVFVTEHEWVRFTPDLHDAVPTELESLRRQHAPSGTARSDGRFTLTGLEPANYLVYVDAAGFEPLCARDVTPGPQELRLQLVRQATLRLDVRDAETGAPIMDAKIEATRRAAERPLGDEPHLPVKPTSEPGVFVVERLGVWRTELVVAAPGHATSGFVVQGAVPPAAVEFTAELAPQARVGGRVLTTEGQPIAGATVATIAPKDAPVELPGQSATTGPDGRYELSGLTGGEWTLRASGQGRVAAERALTVAPAAVVPDVDFVLEAAATIFGTDFDGVGRPKAGETIRLERVTEDSESEDRVDARSNAQGDYRAEGLGAGRWQVADETSVVVDVAPGQALRVDLHGRPKSVIRGTVLAGGQPKSGALVMALDRKMEATAGFAPARAMVRVGADGRYELEVGAGDWYVQAGGYDPPCGGSSAVPLTLDWGEQRVVDLNFEGERLSIRVVETGSDRSLPGVEMYLERASQDDPLTPAFSLGNDSDQIDFWPHSDAEGHAELPYVQPGRYSLSCMLDGYLPAKITDVVIVAGQPAEVRVALEPAATLGGVARLASGVPVVDRLCLTLRRLEASDSQPKAAYTKGGAFRFKGLTAGAYTLALWTKSPPRLPNTPALELPVTLEAGESKSVELVVPP